MNSKSSSSLLVLEYSFCHHCGHFERLNIVPADSIDTEGNIRSTSKCHIYERSNYRQVFLAVGQFVLIADITQICLRIKWRLRQFCIQQSELLYDGIDITLLTEAESFFFGPLDLDS